MVSQNPMVWHAKIWWLAMPKSDGLTCLNLLVWHAKIWWFAMPKSDGLTWQNPMVWYAKIWCLDKPTPTGSSAVIEVTWHDALKSDGLKKMIKSTKIVYPIQRIEWLLPGRRKKRNCTRIELVQDLAAYIW